MSAKDRARATTSAACQPNSGSMKARCAPSSKDGEPWFVAKDVCDILGIDNPSQAVGRLDDDEKGITNIWYDGRPS